MASRRIGREMIASVEGARAEDLRTQEALLAGIVVIPEQVTIVFSTLP